MKYVEYKSEYQNKLLERFIRFAKIWSTSDSDKADQGIFPSTEQQNEFARVLAEELKDIGLRDVTITDRSYVYGILPPTMGFEKVKPFCLLAHMDTSEETSGQNVNPVLTENFKGKNIKLKKQVISPSEDEELMACAGKNDTIITSDGTTLLGADDKAGISEIITALQFIKEKNIHHGPVEVIFSPDEETGHGMDFVPLKLLKSKHAYTVDGGNLGELETECFNASCAKITFYGKPTHTGNALKNKMINAVTLATDFISNIPASERPETTDGYDGFYGIMEMNGTIEKAEISILLRDFTAKGLKAREEFILSCGKALEKSSGAKIDIDIREQYKNMKEKIQKKPFVVELLKQAYVESEVTPVITPIRGGTDGSRLTEMGIPTPNIFTGGHNFHSRNEWASLNQMTDATNILINLIILHEDL